MRGLPFRRGHLSSQRRDPLQSLAGTMFVSSPVDRIAVLPKIEGRGPVPKLINHDKRRLDLVHTTWELIAADGIHAATVRRVAERAHVDPGSVRYIFPSQAELLAAAVAELRTRVVADAARRQTAYSRPDQATARLIASLPDGGESKLLRRVESALRFGARQIPRLESELASCHVARAGECRQALAALAYGLEVSEQTLDFEFQRTYALIGGLGEQLSDSAALLSAVDARNVLSTHLRGVRLNWELALTVKRREQARDDAAKARAREHLA
jgi:AcrR family transcriptional regulator